MVLLGKDFNPPQEGCPEEQVAQEVPTVFPALWHSFVFHKDVLVPNLGCPIKSGPTNPTSMTR